MRKKVFLFTLLIIPFFSSLSAQTGTIKGTVQVDGQVAEFAQLLIDSTSWGTLTDHQGKFIIQNIPYGRYKITASYVGFAKVTQAFVISDKQSNIKLEFNLTEHSMLLDDIVITGTKTHRRRTNSPVIVNVINSQTMSNVQACTLSDGLKFQAGLRVETNCQTCNYTQLRMNGMGGAYTQILINGRPVFSPLTGLYGLEQIPTNMIERLEIVRGGGSSLYGSSAIGGTVNVITKIPRNNSFEMNYSLQNIGLQTNEQSIGGNVTLLSENKNSGISIFVNQRERGLYDANADQFSEIPLLKNTALGTKMFFHPTKNQSLELHVNYLKEYRFGGQMVPEKPAHLALQSEERTHYVWMAGVDYQLDFNRDKSSFITYLAWQNTDRKHYTGIMPAAEDPGYEDFLANPPYGISDVRTYNTGIQINHQINPFFVGKQVLTLGAEYVFDHVLDEIPAYNYLIDQTTQYYGLFVQSDWEIIPQLTLLSGVRMDKHNLMDQAIFSPRVSLLYKHRENTQFRLSYGTGYRAPQAFDTDLHIAFAGGGISRVSLSPDLKHENSQSFSTSINYDKPMEHWIAGFTLEGFYNRLNHAFYLQPIGQDEYGELFEKQNGDGATVKGVTLELRANYDRKIQLESGYTAQTNKFDSKVEYIAGVEGMREFSRTPNNYAYSVVTITPDNPWKVTLNYLYTGKMKVPHFAGAANQSVDEIVTTDAFSELSAKVSYTVLVQSLGTNIELYGGAKNIFNAYQSDFDVGKNRDSNYVYGPALPGTIFIGIKLKSK